MRVNLGRRNIGMAEHLLNDAQVFAPFPQMVKKLCRKRCGINAFASSPDRFACFFTPARCAQSSFWMPRAERKFRCRCGGESPPAARSKGKPPSPRMAPDRDEPSPLPLPTTRRIRSSALKLPGAHSPVRKCADRWHREVSIMARSRRPRAVVSIARAILHLNFVQCLRQHRSIRGSDSVSVGSRRTAFFPR